MRKFNDDDNNLLEDTNPCHLSLTNLSKWLEKNQLLKKDFEKEQKKWKQELTIGWPSLLTDTELLIAHEDILLLQVKNENAKEYLAKNYQISEQKFCQKLFGESKHLIILTKKQWNELSEEQKFSENCLILWKDEIAIRSNLAKWLTNLPR